MAKLVQAVFVRDPDRHATVLLLPGEEPEPRLAALVTNPEAWEGGKLPTSAKSTDTTTSSDSEDGNGDGDKPAAKRTARKPARGRSAADEGSSGD
ncbi:hypothetical protein GCM10018777_56230 [Streptomyces albogriseolus]|uniref:hypothetical protein n=1 Tax=Streptomyces TaxID=1883 RepID=UPI00167291AB|nr:MULTISPECIES: hypothetical protein [Streptomyces]GHB14103.1 hypothetical protein GCM10010330_79850 [Streptomyces tendae]GHG32989.1 hypothetical protein GCM10018777_56230 [Streptomyces viridodiastaticus]